MTAWFADTHYFLAVLNAADEAHGQARELTRSARARLVTTHWVLTEVGNALREPANRGRFARLLAALQSKPDVEIVEASGALFDGGVRLYGERPDKAWSLTDCISFVVMQERGIHDALTGDRHFEQAGFVALLK